MNDDEETTQGKNKNSVVDINASNYQSLNHGDNTTTAPTTLRKEETSIEQIALEK